ncbi:hypothetical protein ACVI1K_008535 [Bradyrhizobium sp. USDA 4508]
MTNASFLLNLHRYLADTMGNLANPERGQPCE